jgi:hypothetical protein
MRGVEIPIETAELFFEKNKIVKEEGEKKLYLETVLQLIIRFKIITLP